VVIGAKRYLKVKLNQARRLYAETFHAFSTADLLTALRTLDIQPGDTLLVHSSYDAFQGFGGKPSDVIATLQEAVGVAGNLMLPTLPFTGTAVAYARTNPVFDVKRTPSRTGLLTEMFRRSPAVVRSVHPTHAVAVWGKDAAALIDQHYAVETPCGEGSPFARLLDTNGKILLLGVDISSLTLYHTVEALLEKKFPVSPFTIEVFNLQSRDAAGTLLTTRTRLFEPAISRRRNLYKLVAPLKSAGAWRQKRLGQMDLVVLKANEVLSAIDAMADRREYCYD
jgi:aminoglycoside 3-N-acetyltransferase